MEKETKYTIREAIKWIEDACIDLEKKQDWTMIKKLEAIKKVIVEDYSHEEHVY